MVNRRYSVRYDVQLACQTLSQADAKLATLIERAGPFALSLKGSHSPFEALLESIIYQQLHGNAAAAILRRLIALFGDLHPDPAELLSVPETQLRAVGLSQNKMLAVRDLSQKALDGTVPSLAQIRRLTDKEIVDRLTLVRGVGVWTAEMFLIFRLGRPDVLPLTDYGVRKGFLLTFGGKSASRLPISAAMLPQAQTMLRRGERWRPWRSVASWYLWRACDLAATRSPAKAASSA